MCEAEAGIKKMTPLVGLARPLSGKIVIPIAFVQKVSQIKSEDESRPAISGHAAGKDVFFFPVAHLDVDVRTMSLAGGATLALRIVGARSGAHSGRLGVDLFDDGDGTKEIAPGLAGKNRAGDKGRGKYEKQPQA